jgi:putative hydrolase of the HAD superfamily
MKHLPRAILFDLDDTILHAYGRPYAAWLRLCEAMAEALLPLPPDIIAAAVDRQSEWFWADAARHKAGRLDLATARRRIVAAGLAALAAEGRPVPATAVGEMLADRFTALREEELTLFPGAVETLEALQAAGVRLALITNGAALPQRRKVVRFALERHFQHVQIEGEHGFGKPEERAYRHAMAVLGVMPHETWMVGDNLEWEVVAPQRLGIRAIWCDAYAAGLPAGSPIRPDRIIRRLPELLAE